jgi:hypothetical protein
MTGLPATITIVIALLAIFLVSITALKYFIKNNFVRTRLMMTALFAFIIITLTIAFRDSVSLTLPYTTPALFTGIVLGYLIGVQTERQKLMTHGLEYYMEHFAHIHSKDVRTMTWWSVVNFYSIMCGLVLINMVGFTTVILQGSPLFTIITSVVGALLIGSIVPYLAHLWSFPITHRHLVHHKHQGEHQNHY